MSETTESLPTQTVPSSPPCELLHVRPVSNPRAGSPDGTLVSVVLAPQDRDLTDVRGFIVSKRWLVGAVAFQLGGPLLLSRLRRDAHRPIGDFTGGAL